MPYAFSTPITSAIQLQDQTLWASLIGACNERLASIFDSAPKSVRTFDPFIPTNHSIPILGTNIQLAGWWASTQSAPGDSFGMQAAINYMVPSDGSSQFCDHTLTYDGNASRLFFGNLIPGELYPEAAWTIPKLRTHASLPVTLTRPITHGINDNTFWHRKRPREIQTTVDTHDVQGNSAIAGQIAYLIGGGGLGPGNIYICIASGNWQPITMRVPPDILDNTLDYPNTISYVDVHGNQNLTGQVLNGDYIGTWIFEEVRQLVNLLRWRWSSPRNFGDPISSTLSPDLFATTTTYHHSNAFPSGPLNYTSSISYADLNAYLSANWTNANYSGASSDPQYPFALSFETDDGSSFWFGSVQRGDSMWHATSLSTLTKDIDWYVYSEAPPPTSVPSIFNAEGDPAANGIYHKWHTDASVSATSIFSPQFGDANPIPPTLATSNSYTGYVVTDAVLILKFDVTYGYQYLF